MKVLEFDAAQAREITRFDSDAATAVPLTMPEGEAHVVCIRLGLGGVLGRHPAPVDQLFLVGAAVHRAAGEEPESGTDGGLTAIAVEAKRLMPHERHG